MVNYKQKICLITGAASIGMGIAEKLLSLGGTVVVGALSDDIARDSENLYGETLTYVETDISKDKDLET